MTTPEPAVIVTHYEVSCLPENHHVRRHFTIQVRYCGDGHWFVSDIYGDGYDENGDQGVFRSDQRRQFDLDTALALAKRIAPTLVVNGRTVADVLARGGGQ